MCSCSTGVIIDDSETFISSHLLLLLFVTMQLLLIFRIAAVDQRSPATESPPANLMFLKKGEANVCGHRSVESAKCSPEVDNPLSLHFERNVSDISRRISNESSSERPVAAVAPTRQTSETVSNTEEDNTVVKLPFNEEENHGETGGKPQNPKEESRLKHAQVMLPCDKEGNKKQMAVESQFEDTEIKEAYLTNITPKANTKTSAQQKMNDANRSLPESALETDESFVVVEKNELTFFVKKKVQTDGPGKVKSLATENKLPRRHHEGCSSEPCLSSPEKGTEAMMMDENFYDMEKAGGAEAGLVKTCPSASNLGSSSSSSTSAMSSPSPTKKCILS